LDQINIFFYERLDLVVSDVNEKLYSRDHRGRDRMVVGYTTTYAIGAYHH